MNLQTLLDVGLNHFLILSAILFGLGLLTVATRRNAVAILMGVELILNAAALNFVAFSHYVQGLVGGQVFALFIIVLAAAEAAIALAIVLNFYNNHLTIDVDRGDDGEGGGGEHDTDGDAGDDALAEAALQRRAGEAVEDGADERE